MGWISELFSLQTAAQAIIVISLVSAVGLALGRIKVFGISLGVTFVFFAGIFMRHFGLNIDPVMLNYAESFGLVVFVYALGLQVGPGFFASLRRGGIRLNMLAMGVVFLGVLMTLIFHYTTGVSLPDMMGVMSGAVTNTPSLGAAQQTLKQIAPEVYANSDMALSCAVTYPLGVVGVIIAMAALRRLFVGSAANISSVDSSAGYKTYIAEFQVDNPGVCCKSIKDIAGSSSKKFIISRLWRDGNVSIPTSETIIDSGDKILLITSEADVAALTILFGRHQQTDWNKSDIDWNAIDSQLVSMRVLVTRPEINGKKLETLKLRNHYGINITRVYRAGVELLPTSELMLQLGDRLTIVGEAAAVTNVEKVLGNKVKSLKEPNLVAVFLGLSLGLLIGAIPVAIPGISFPVKLGIAGGPIVVGILMGAFGPRFHMVTYTTQSANLMLRGIGLSIYLACLGLDAGNNFFSTVFRPEGAIWVGLGFAITFVPVVIMGAISMRVFKTDFGSVCGMLCGSMANPMALGYANTTIEGDSPSVSYATVYPLSMFARVIIAQLMLMLFL